MFILHKYAHMSFHPSMIELRIVIQLTYIMICDTHCQMYNNLMENLIHILCIFYTTLQKRVVSGSKKPFKTHKFYNCYNFMIIYIKIRSIPTILFCNVGMESYTYIIIFTVAKINTLVQKMAHSLR